MSTKEIILGLSLFTMGCGNGVNFGQGNVLNPHSLHKNDPIPQCEIDIPQLAIAGRVLDFSVDKSGGGSIGYGGIQGVDATVSFKASFAELALSLDVKDFMLGGEIAYGDAKSTQTRGKVDATVGYKEWKGGGFYEGAAPISDVTQKGADIAVLALKKNSDDYLTHNPNGDPKIDPNLGWIGRITDLNSDQTVDINAGRFSNVQVNDEFYVYNTTHKWNGDPCNSIYRGESPDAQPSATIRVNVIGDNITTAVIISQTAPIKKGARVVLKGLFPIGTNRVLAKRAVLNLVQARNFMLPGDDPTKPPSFDFQGAVNYQVLESITTHMAFDIKP